MRNALNYKSKMAYILCQERYKAMVKSLRRKFYDLELGLDKNFETEILKMMTAITEDFLCTK